MKNGIKFALLLFVCCKDSAFVLTTRTFVLKNGIFNFVSQLIGVSHA